MSCLFTSVDVSEGQHLMTRNLLIIISILVSLATYLTMASGFAK